MMDIPILYEDSDLVVIDKPYGIVVNNAGTVKGETIQDWSVSRIKNNEPNVKNEVNKDFFDRNGIVHRLDKETSGCLIIAKNFESFTNLQKSFKNRLVKKTYISLVHGLVVSGSGTVNVPVGRLVSDHEKFGVVPGAKEAETDYTVTCFYKREKENFTLLKLFPKTGRTHQIRVHMKYMGNPIVGDYLYAGRKQQIHDRKWCPRVFLHAEVISFPHPKIIDKTISVKSPLPEDLKLILDQLTIVN